VDRLFYIGAVVLFMTAALPAQTLPGRSKPSQGGPLTADITTAAAQSAQTPSERPNPLQAVAAATRPPDPAAPPSPAPTARLQFPNSDIVDVLHYYEQLTG
jgi:hypothetical protein